MKERMECDTMLDFVILKYKGKAIYLGVDESRHSKDPYKTFFKWVKDKNEATWFSCEGDAERFAKSYFKNFKNWEFELVNGAKYL